jgi:hypothetical protein
MGRTPLGWWGMIRGMARIGDYTVAPQVAAAGWVTAGLRGRASSVASVVPVGFPAYARVFHPAQRRDSGGGWTPVAWREVAAANGRVAHRAMQWCSLTGCCSLRGDDCRPQPGVWDVEPATGHLPRELAVVLAEVLADQTTTPRRCWFAVWDGFADLAVPEVEDAGSFAVPQRRMLLLAGAITAVGSSSLSLAPGWQSPNLWWPDDRAWCVATDIDLMSTYVGGSRGGVQAIVADRRLEAAAVQASDGVAADADTVNPSVHQPSAPAGGHGWRRGRLPRR